MTFQFHKGTIRTNYPKELAIRQTNFNSIKVRLKLQFSYDYKILKGDFNSIKVRLKLLGSCLVFIRYEISIP